MNHRLSICCDTCNQGIALRLGLGTQKKQIVAFQCPKCKQKIALEMTIDKSKMLYQPEYKILENCTFTAEKDSFIAINLHTEMVYPKELINEKVIMPAPMVSMKLQEHAEKKGFLNPVISSASSGFFGIPTLSLFDSIGGDSNLLEDWLVVKKAYSLYESGMFDLMEKELSKYTRRKEAYVNNSLLHSIIFDFLNRFISPNTIMFNKIKKNFNDAKKQRTEFKNFKNYYQLNLQDIHWKNYIDIFNEYFENFSEFNRLLLNAKIELHPDEGAESFFCPVNFDNVKMFYGNAYEYITTNLTIFACVNNIINSRKYDEFASMTLKKYSELNKESRLNPLKTNTTFDLFTENIESTLRNASHHKWFYIDKTNPGYLLYRSGGTGAIHQLSYIDYIYESNLLMIKLAIMAMLEIKFLLKNKHE